MERRPTGASAVFSDDRLDRLEKGRKEGKEERTELRAEPECAWSVREIGL